MQVQGQTIFLFVFGQRIGRIQKKKTTELKQLTVVQMLIIKTTQVPSHGSYFSLGLRRHDYQIELIGTNVPWYLVETVIQ